MNNLLLDKTLNVDIPEIDEDHLRLMELFNTLSVSVAKGRENRDIAAVLGELISSAAAHFRREEQLMMKYGYEDLAKHESEHEDLMATAKTLQQELLQEGVVLSEDIQFLEHWLIGHIRGSDMRLGSYLRKVM